MRPTLLLLPLLALGCAAAPLTCPDKGGPPWRALRSDHFDLRTDAAEDAARKQLEALEQVYGAFEDVAFPNNPKPQGAIRIIAFTDPRAYAVFGPQGSDGYYTSTPNDPEREPTLVVSGDLRDDVRELFQHELTHRFMAFYFPSAPMWLNEGMADLHATLRLSDGNLYLGERRGGLFFSDEHATLVHKGGLVYAALPIPEMPSPDELRELDHDGFYASNVEDPARAEQLRHMHYASASSFVHVLHLGDEGLHKRFRTYLQALTAATADPGAAFQAAFGDLPQGTLEKAYYDYLHDDEPTVPTMLYTPRTASIPDARPMSDAEVHVLWARLRDWDKPPQRAAAQADLDEAIRIAPEDPETWLARGNLRAEAGDSPGAEQDLKKAVALAPDGPRYLYPLASFRSAAESSLPPEQQVWDDVEPLVAKLQKMTTSTSQRNFVANYWLARGRPERAAVWATKAIDADASCAGCYETAASVLAAQGKLCDAVIAQRVAINLMPEELRTKARMDRLRALTKAIKEANACPKAP